MQIVGRAKRRPIHENSKTEFQIKFFYRKFIVAYFLYRQFLFE